MAKFKVCAESRSGGRSCVSGGDNLNTAIASAKKKLNRNSYSEVVSAENGIRFAECFAYSGTCRRTTAKDRAEELRLRRAAYEGNEAFIRAGEARRAAAAGGLSGWQRKQHKKKRRAKRGGSQCRRLDGRFKRC